MLRMFLISARAASLMVLAMGSMGYGCAMKSFPR